NIKGYAGKIQQPAARASNSGNKLAGAIGRPKVLPGNSCRLCVVPAPMAPPRCVYTSGRNRLDRHSLAKTVAIRLNRPGQAPPYWRRSGHARPERISRVTMGVTE